ncbi:hypothetical protein NDU88_002405 [Pleurodeles waltl]|uniref:Uncharacterized protein n=1 Tax=Pleurodeles waltl TaxID=8319 RepID=A0AAV7MN94_PLEWA|nr:hypothetical protein NDU88_002405 [Pleurodeles waltl]
MLAAVTAVAGPSWVPGFSSLAGPKLSDPLSAARSGGTGLPQGLPPLLVLRVPLDQGSQVPSTGTAPGERITSRQPQRDAGARGQERPPQPRPRKVRSGRSARRGQARSSTLGPTPSDPGSPAPQAAPQSRE